MLARIYSPMGFTNKVDFVYVPFEFGTKRGMGQHL